MQGLTEAQSGAMKRAGLVLALIGLFDIVQCGIAVMNGESYSSSLNVFALVTGILIYRGGTGAARFAQKGLSFILGALLVFPLLVPLLMPPRLLWLLLRLSSLSALLGLVTIAALLALLYWIRATLASLPLYPGGANAPPLHKSRAALAGAALSLVIAVALSFALGGDSGQRAVEEARRKVGPGYSFFVQQLTAASKRGSATVIAYSQTEMKEVHVQWQDE